MLDDFILYQKIKSIKNDVPRNEMRNVYKKNW